ncbi:hypothetical protein [Corynebacterium ulceribovis]|uniref:hypothetical protein n=1 Tax=Corynebacterium ulceribovis TaxID=487732 RepID=UPI00037BE351|nr:hypothetical protein [Corynebacterium ulceribovis]
MNKRQTTSFLLTAVVTAIAIACARIFDSANAPFFIAMAAFAVTYGALDIWRARTNETADIRVKVQSLDAERYKSIAFESGRGAAIRAIQEDHEGISKAHAQRLWRDIIELERGKPQS